ncbi:hypothetical protein ET495_10360 [Xylanimonas allomyrinae]|uniref:HTH luxR-type domain-containing protein n=1 Tax=Xylanimonas allomyrinae TaxID=2509459 RepID=A0A4P6EP86_9MICO|nr:hypothetical protein [Xylanimonas allomyrinae]QAY63583.1 hypothetical protein ET495_10360 [Xylanimonas allomyrinae]
MSSNVLEDTFGELLTSASDFLRDDISVHLVGPRRSGRSLLALEIAERARNEGFGVLTVTGNPAWRKEPFTALALSGLDFSSGLRSSPQAVVELSRLLGSRRWLVVCDDADDLDQQTVGALLAMCRRRRLVFVATTRGAQRFDPDGLVVGLTPLVQLAVPPLSHDRIQRIAVDTLGAPLDQRTLSRVATLTGGSFGLARAMMRVGRHTGALTEGEGAWFAPGSLWSDELAALADTFLAGTSDTARDCATALALTGPLEPKEAVTIFGQPALDALLSAGLAHDVADGPRTLVGLVPPLLASHLRREGSPVGRLLVRERAGAYAHRALMCRTEGPGRAHAAVVSERLRRIATAWVDRQRDAWEADPSPGAALDLVEALRGTGAPTASIECVLQHSRPGDVLDAAMLVFWEAVWRAVDLGDLAAAVDLLRGARERLPGFGALLRAAEAYVVCLCDRIPADALLADPDPADHPVCAEVVALARAEVALELGNVLTAAEIADGVRSPHRALAPALATLNAHARMLGNDVRGAVEDNLRGLEEAYEDQDPQAVQHRSTAAMAGLYMSGRLDEADDVLERALSVSSVLPPRDPHRSGLLAMGAEVAVLQGRPEFARQMTVQPPVYRTVDGMFRGLLPSTLPARGPEPRPDDAAGVWEAVRERLERGHVASAVPFAVAAAELGRDLELTDSVCQVAARMESPVMRMLGEYVEAAVLADADRLADVTIRLGNLGVLGYAVQAAVTRGVLLYESGKLREAALAADEAWEMSEACGRHRAGFFVRLRSQVALSAREVEVVQARARWGSSSRAADALQASVRTVETHLYNASRKSGVSGADALAQAVATWLGE